MIKKRRRGFDSEKYIKAQSREIFKRLNIFDRLYLEIGGKLVYDMHASRVLPGYDKTSKVKILKELGDFESIYCINSKDIISKRHLGDFDLSYKKQFFKDLKDIRKSGFDIDFVCITRYEGERGVRQFKKHLEEKGLKVYVHHEIKNYGESVAKIIEAYGKESLIPVKKKIVVVTGTSGGSGKMSTALNQIYLERRKGIKSGFAKFETFPIWNLPLKHPINLAYEAATADLGDYNVIDPFHLNAYGKRAVNYNRDVENFEVLLKIAKRTFGRGEFPYKSPTDMGVNMAKRGIVNDAVCRRAALKEIKRRWRIYSREFKKGRESKKTLERMKEIMKDAGIVN